MVDTFTIECDKTEGYENEDFTFRGRATRDGLPVVPTNGLRWGVAIGYRASTVPIFPITYDPNTGLYIPDALLDDNGEFSITLKPEIIYQNTGFTRTKYRSTFYIGLYEPTKPPSPPSRFSVRGASLDVIVHPVHGVHWPLIPQMDTVIYEDTTTFGKSYTGQCVYEEAIFLCDFSNITSILANCIPQDRIVPPPPNPMIQENKVLRVECDSIYNAEQDKLLIFNDEQFYPFKVRAWSVPSDWDYTDPHTIYSIFPLGEIVYETSYPPSVGNIDESYLNEYQTWIPSIIPDDGLGLYPLIIIGGLSLAGAIGYYLWMKKGK